LGELSPQHVSISAHSTPQHDGTRVDVIVKNDGREVALATKITLLDDAGFRVLPVYYQDNYVALLPGESRRIAVQCPASSGRCARVALRGWNVQASNAKIL
jgi:hypothetical protein